MHRRGKELREMDADFFHSAVRTPVLLSVGEAVIGGGRALREPVTVHWKNVSTASLTAFLAPPPRGGPAAVRTARWD